MFENINTSLINSVTQFTDFQGYIIEINVSDHIAVRWFIVLRGAEADQALLEHEDSERVT